MALDKIDYLEDPKELYELLSDRGYDPEGYESLEKMAEEVATANRARRKAVDFVDSDHFDTFWREVVAQVESDTESLISGGDQNMNDAVRDAFRKGRIQALRGLHQHFLDVYRKYQELAKEEENAE